MLPATVVALFAAGCGAQHGHAVATPPSTLAKVPKASPTSRSTHDDSIVATAGPRSLAVYRSVNATRPILRLDNPTASGAPLSFLVRSTRARRVEVDLPVRPNGAHGWVDRASLTLARDPYRIVIHLRAHRLVLLARNRVVLRFPVAVGRSATPTPKGLFYIVDLLAQPDPTGAYGPFAFGLSAYSPVLFTFGGGPGEIGIHGTNEPDSIGHSVSHGCIRLRDAAITKLSRLLPLGTPVKISS